MIENFYYSSPLFQGTCLLYLLAFLGYVSSLFFTHKFLSKNIHLLFYSAFICCTLLIVGRWIAAGRPPFKTLYESLIFAGWTVSLVHVFLSIRLKIPLLCVLSNLGVLFIFGYALSQRDVEIIALPPALQTWLFIPHVISYFLAYGALFIAGISALLYFFYPNGIKTSPRLGKQQLVDLSSVTYSVTKFGFLLLTLGLLLGAWWGQMAWSNYWGWDPKENWALVSWLIFATYLHARNLKFITKKQLSWFVVIGVLAIVFTYLGMSYLPTANDSLHVYTES